MNEGVYDLELMRVQGLRKLEKLLTQLARKLHNAIKVNIDCAWLLQYENRAVIVNKLQSATKRGKLKSYCYSILDFDCITTGSFVGPLSAIFSDVVFIQQRFIAICILNFES